jgi:hypothetical protein
MPKKKGPAPISRSQPFANFPSNFNSFFVSGKRDLNPRPSPWQGDALPLSYSRVFWAAVRRVRGLK